MKRTQRVCLGDGVAEAIELATPPVPPAPGRTLPSGSSRRTSSREGPLARPRQRPRRSGVRGSTGQRTRRCDPRADARAPPSRSIRSTARLIPLPLHGARAVRRPHRRGSVDGSSAPTRCSAARRSAERAPRLRGGELVTKLHRRRGSQSAGRTRHSSRSDSEADRRCRGASFAGRGSPTRVEGSRWAENRAGPLERVRRRGRSPGSPPAPAASTSVTNSGLPARLAVELRGSMPPAPASPHRFEGERSECAPSYGGDSMRAPHDDAERVRAGELVVAQAREDEGTQRLDAAARRRRTSRLASSAQWTSSRTTIVGSGPVR